MKNKYIRPEIEMDYISKMDVLIASDPGSIDDGADNWVDLL